MSDLDLLISAAIGISGLAVGLVGAGHALLNQKTPAAALGWIALCIAVPWLGVGIYVLLGINRVQRRADRMRDQRSQNRQRATSPEQHAELDNNCIQSPEALNADLGVYSAIASASHRISGWPLTQGNSIQPLINGDKAYPAMLEAIKSASKRVWLMTYLFDHGPTGKAFVAELIAAKERGVQVNVLIDGVGGMFMGRRAYRKLRRNDVSSTRFIPPRLIPPALRINLRNHRKLLLVDDDTGFTGGLNIDSHCVVGKTKKNAIRDLHFKVSGPVLLQLEEAFIADWHFATGDSLPSLNHRPESSGGTWARALLDEPTSAPKALTHILCAAIATAKHSIRIITPYFLPPPELLSALSAAVLRGLEVTVLIPEKSDHSLVNWATQSRLGEPLQLGIKILQTPKPFAHTKLFMVDDYWALFGSSNLDPRSLRLNFELCVEQYGEDLVSKLTPLFNAYAEESTELSYASWKQRPLPQRLRDAIAWLGSGYL